MLIQLLLTTLPIVTLGSNIGNNIKNIYLDIAINLKGLAFTKEILYLLLLLMSASIATTIITIIQITTK